MSKLSVIFCAWFWMSIIGVLSACGSERETGEKALSDLPEEKGYQAVLDNEAITLIANGKNVLRYQIAHHAPPDTVDPIFGRSAFIHPLWSPNGDVLSRINPPDHWHHYGIWNPWTRTRIGNRATDFWNLGEGQGTVRNAGVDTVWSGDNSTGFRVVHDHIGFTDSGSEEKLIHETWTVTVRAVDPINGKDVFLWDMEISLSPATPDSVILEAYRYGGGIGFRATEDWTVENSWVITSEGETRATADGTHARWAIVGGVSESQQPSSLLFMSHPDNRAHPEPMRVWPPDANEGRGDMYFEFCPIRHVEWVLQAGSEYHLSYRIVVTEGRLDPESAEILWQVWANADRQEAQSYSD